MARPEIRCVLDAKAKTGEGAVWDVAEQALFWVDIPQGLLHRFDPVTGENRTWPMGEPIGCLALRQTGGAVVALKSGVYLFDLESGAKTPLCSPEADRPANRFNDGATDPKGRLWAGTMKLSGPAEPTGAFYRIEPDGRWTRWLDGIFTTNGQTFSPDGRTYYCSETHADVQTIWAADYDPDSGEAGERRVFFDAHAVAGRPDGGTVDADGCSGWPASAAGSSCASRPRARSTGSSTCRSSGPPSPCSGAATRHPVRHHDRHGPHPWQRGAAAAGGRLFAVTGLGVTGLPQTRFAG